MDHLQFATSPDHRRYMVAIGPGPVMLHAGNPAGGGLGLAFGALWARLLARRRAWHVEVSALDADNRPTGTSHREDLADRLQAEARMAEIVQAITNDSWSPPDQ